ncbi:glyoxylate pathway regulator [Cucurbitaria berberidis CBS 394.84]|uniref:Glyoxylate pathway regulator n=1 Tax=Cucurbitaria berberidis CBS 394.84 TaxID=1168544 RepID=A0A9P4L5D7_9PLEO|nr:glyoxylate pathway regulator [Cucurbitaria berberidis CBS 394.84]KAF1842242.1 glyoxylate pathway regulator [Cucurbitaria berberidis CBS 394.84]
MATAIEHTEAPRGPSFEKSTNGTNTLDHAHNGKTTRQRAPYDYGGNPLAHVATNDPEMRLTAFGGDFQPGLYRAPNRKFANPAPLGLSAFALTTFVLSLINVNTRGIGHPNIVVALAYGYGGLVQLLAGMWEMAIGNTFGATALSSYGGFWLSFAIILTPGGFSIESDLIKFGEATFLNSFGLYLMGWFIFTFILLICTLRSTVAFFFLFFTLDLAFLLLGIGYLQHDGKHPQGDCIKAGGAFGLMAAFAAWYNALAGIADSSNSFFIIPVAHFPWSDKGREHRDKVDNSTARDAAHTA